MLRGFELASGLCINLNKSKLYGVHLDDSLLQATSAFLACEIGKLPFLFLGIMLELIINKGKLGLLFLQSYAKDLVRGVASTFRWE